MEETQALRSVDLKPSKVLPEPDFTSGSAKKESVSEIFSEEIIIRAPDKMIDYKDGCIWLAYREKMIYLDVSSHKVEVYPASATSGTNKNQKSPVPKTISRDITLSNDKISTLNLQKNFKIISIQEIGKSVSAIVIEDRRNRQIRFLKV
jgi:hypothetical protein